VNVYRKLPTIKIGVSLNEFKGWPRVGLTTGN
jgi:hypothetical protein